MEHLAEFAGGLLGLIILIAFLYFAPKHVGDDDDDDDA